MKFIANVDRDFERKFIIIFPQRYLELFVKLNINILVPLGIDRISFT